MSRVGIGIRPPKKRPLGIVDVNVLYHSLNGSASPQEVSCLFSAPATILSGRLPTRNVSGRFMDPGAFVGTNATDEPITSGLPVTRAQLHKAPVHRCGPRHTSSFYLSCDLPQVIIHVNLQ